MMGIQEESENLENDGFSMPYPQQRRGGGMDLGLNPANYANIEDEVHAELMQA